MSADREHRLVQAFFAPEERPRYAALLSKTKGRRKSVCRLTPGEQDIDAIYKELQRRGAPNFRYVVSEDARMDRRQVTLRDVLERMIGAGMGTFPCRVPGRLAYFEGEEIGERYVCERGDL